MDFKLEPKHEAFLEEFRGYLDHLAKDNVIDLKAVRAEYGKAPMELGTMGRAFVRQLGEDGWLGVGTKKQYGGQGRGYVEQWLFMEELKYRSLPTGQLLVQSIIPALSMLAPEDIRERFLPLCLSGSIMVCIGYSEPGAGSDLAALQTKAVKVEGGYRISGQKIWTTNGHLSTHIWLAVRTGAPDSRHRGISLFIVPMDSPGIEIAPIITQGDERTNHVYFENVFVEERDRIGGENEGWRFIMAQLAFERLFCISEMKQEFHSLLHWWKDNQPEDYAERESQLRELGRQAAEIEACSLMAKRTAWMMDQGLVPEVEASILKFYYTSRNQRNAVDGLRLMGGLGQINISQSNAPAHGRVERAYRVAPSFTFGAGANEVQRDIVAERGLGMRKERVGA